MIEQVKSIANFEGLSPFSQTYKDRLEGMAHEVNLWQKFRRPLIDLLAKGFPRPPKPATPPRHVQTTDNINNGPNQWKYGYTDNITGEAVDPTDPTAAINSWELHNDGAADEGFGVVVGNLVSHTVTMLPIPYGVHVWLHTEVDDDGKVFYSFEAPNAYLVECNK